MVTELHQLFSGLKRYKFPLSAEDRKEIPANGIYIFFEEGEEFNNLERVVRVGTHDGENQLLSRLEEHITHNKNRSIFRKNIGRCFLNKNNNPYLNIWDIDTTSKQNKAKYSHKIDTSFEADLEQEITQYLTENMSFCVFKVEGGKKQRNFWEAKIIATLAQSDAFRNSISKNWLGKHSPKKNIANSGLWLIEGLKSEPLTQKEFDELKKIILKK